MANSPTKASPKRASAKATKTKATSIWLISKFRTCTWTTKKPITNTRRRRVRRRQPSRRRNGHPNNEPMRMQWIAFGTYDFLFLAVHHHLYLLGPRPKLWAVGCTCFPTEATNDLSLSALMPPPQPPQHGCVGVWVGVCRSVWVCVCGCVWVSLSFPREIPKLEWLSY